MTTKTDKSVHIYYSGLVQGVGFRYTAERLANSLKLAGWARNLPDGRVEIFCQGSEPDIKTFLRKINDTFREYLKDADMEWGAARAGLDTFDIRF